jgi:hypothetical protein
MMMSMNKVRLCGKRCLLSSITHWMINNTTFLFSNMKTMHGIDIRNKFNIVHRTLAYTIMIKVILCGLHFARLHLSWPSQRFGFWGRVVFWGRCMPFAIFEFGAPRQHSRAKFVTRRTTTPLQQNLHCKKITAINTQRCHLQDGLTPL